MNKSFKILFSLLAIFALVMTGCKNVSSFSPEVGGEDDVIAAITTGTNGVEGQDLNSVTVNAGGIENTTAQTITVTFPSGVVDLNGTSIPGLTIYNLTTNATAGAAKTRGAAIAYTAEVVQSGANSSYAILTMDLTGASTPIEVYMAASTLTANSGTRYLDLDLDDVAGESEDDFVGEYGVGTATGKTAPTVATGGTRAPRTLLTGSGFAATIAVGTTSLPTSAGITDSNGTYNLTTAILNGAYNLELLTNGVFAAHANSGAYDTTTGVYTMTIAAATAGQVYRASLNDYALYESQAINGYVHRGSYDQRDVSGNMNYQTITVGPTQTFAACTDGGIGGQPYIELNTDGTYLDKTAITSSSVKILVEYDHDVDGSYYDFDSDGDNDLVDTDGDGRYDILDANEDGDLDFIDGNGDGLNDYDVNGDGIYDPLGPSGASPDIWQLFSFTTQRVDDNTVRLLLPANVGIKAGNAYKVVVQPTIKDLGADLTVATDDLLHIGVSGGGDSVNDDLVMTLEGTF